MTSRWLKDVMSSLCALNFPNFGSRPNTTGGNSPSVRTSVRPQKVSSISMKFGIQVVLNERWKGNDHARIQDQGQGQEPMKVGNSTIFKLSPSPFIMGSGKWPRNLKLGGQYLKFNRSDFWNSSSFFVTWPLNSGPNHVWQVSGSRPSVFLRG